MKKRFLERLEIVFWTTLVMLMSESAIVRTMLRHSHLLFGGSGKRSYLVQAAVWGSAGITIGFALGVLGKVLW